MYFFFLFPFFLRDVYEINSLAFTFYFSWFFSFLHPNQIKTKKNPHARSFFFISVQGIFLFIYKKGRTGGCRKTFPLLPKVFFSYVFHLVNIHKPYYIFAVFTIQFSYKQIVNFRLFSFI